MMDLLSVRPDELRGVRMFSVAADRAELDRLQAILAEAEPGLAEGYLADILGAPAIDATRVEVFDLEDLSNFGLVNYLVKANGLPAEAVEPDRARLEALSGVVLLLYPGAFRDQVLTLQPAEVLTPVGAWDEDIPDLEFTPLRSEAAKGQLADAPPAEPAKAPRWVAWLVAVMVLLGLVAVYAAVAGGT
ncbi:hypothetical protein TL5118_02259 [Thalassovita autumnalis]|uniref:Uncharacterized protein n=1 Tax=Thalassovita autumnalis TaxID=2072972 RepID=A0A0N7LVY5_9RHOB|nr:hypothetical protein [Thalassovita autumnalis]CUH67594.1 hypothetical protein TL5118_02259 [Thalassovita autumnalis]CUH73957.1 hypothetical protein TL5120_03774 [Thalassovita autumnalis]